NLPDGIDFKDASGRFLRVNQAVADYFGVSDPSDVVGKTSCDFLSEESATATAAAEQAILQSGRPLVSVEERVTLRDGRLELVSTPRLRFRDKDGKIIGTFGVSRNISARKRAEDLATRLQQQMEPGVSSSSKEAVAGPRDITGAPDVTAVQGAPADGGA